MDPHPKSSWWIQTGRDLVDGDIEGTVLVTRLGMSVNALRAQHRWTSSLVRGSSVVNMSDFIQSFVTAVAYTREALNILTGTGRHIGYSQQVRALAGRVGVSPELRHKIGRLMGGAHPASELLVRVRNQLGFHWDTDVGRPAIEALDDERLVWVEGRGLAEGDSVYRFAGDVLVNALLPGIEQQSESEARERIRKASANVTDAMDAVATYFAAAIAGYLVPNSPQRHLRWFHRPVELRRKVSVWIRQLLNPQQQYAPSSKESRSSSRDVNRSERSNHSGDVDTPFDQTNDTTDVSGRVDLRNDPRVAEFARRLPPKLYKYMSVAGERMDWARKLIVDSELYFTRPSFFNDPLDFRIPPSFEARPEEIESFSRRRAEKYSYTEEERRKRVETMVRLSTSPEGQVHLTNQYFEALEKYGVACFVQDPASMLMWSYYADGHRGIAVRFDTTVFLRNFEHACIPLEVKYRRDFPEDRSFYSDDRFGLVQSTLGTKAEAWKHEEEWRLVLVGNAGYVRMPAGMVDGVVLGLRTPLEVEQSIREWLEAKRQPIELLRVRHRPNSFDLEVVPA